MSNLSGGQEFSFPTLFDFYRVLYQPISVLKNLLTVGNFQCGNANIALLRVDLVPFTLYVSGHNFIAPVNCVEFNNYLGLDSNVWERITLGNFYHPHYPPTENVESLSHHRSPNRM